MNDLWTMRKTLQDAVDAFELLAVLRGLVFYGTNGVKNFDVHVVELVIKDILASNVELTSGRAEGRDPAIKEARAWIAKQ